jgi:hypothetical protein
MNASHLLNFEVIRWIKRVTCECQQQHAGVLRRQLEAPVPQTRVRGTCSLTWNLH